MKCGAGGSMPADCIGCGEEMLGTKPCTRKLFWKGERLGEEAVGKTTEDNSEDRRGREETGGGKGTVQAKRTPLAGYSRLKEDGQRLHAPEKRESPGPPPSARLCCSGMQRQASARDPSVAG